MQWSNLHVQSTPLNTPTLGPDQLGVISGVSVLTGGIYCTVSNTLGPRKLGVLSGVHCIIIVFYVSVIAGTIQLWTS